MIKKVEKEDKIWNLSVKIKMDQSEKIKQIVDIKESGYRSYPHFIEKAIDFEIKIATLKTIFQPHEKIYFDNLLLEYLNRAYEKTLDLHLKDSSLYKFEVNKTNSPILKK